MELGEWLLEWQRDELNWKLFTGQIHLVLERFYKLREKKVLFAGED